MKNNPLIQKVKCIYGNIHEVQASDEITLPYECLGGCLKKEEKNKCENN